jgi:hypothetical protein
METVPPKVMEEMFQRRVKQEELKITPEVGLGLS